MVAITVLLAAVLYTMIMGFGTSDNQPPSGPKLSDDAYRDHACTSCAWHGHLGDMSVSYSNGYAMYYCPRCGHYFGYR